MRVFLIMLCIALACYANVFAQENNVVYPAGTNVVNVVTDLGVDNTGDVSKAASNTTILQQANLEYKGGSNPGPNTGRTMYFPDGVYYINAPIESKENITFTSATPNGETDAANIHYQGQSESGTVIRIVDGSTAFADASNPKYAISYYQGDNGNNDAFNNSMEDMTINIGSGNAGAGGVEFTSNNVGAIRNVTVKSDDGEGVIGIKMSANLNGLSLLKNVTIDGFERGIFTRAEHCVIVMEDLTLTNQKEYGIYNDSKPIVINKLVSNNNVPALYSVGGPAHVTLTNATFTASETVAGAAVQVKDGAGVFFRSLQSSNFENIATVNGEVIAGSEISEYVAKLREGQPIKLWNNVPDVSIDLKLEDEMVTSLNWTADISKIHVIPAGNTDNDSPMIQEQMNLAASQGKTHVMFASNGTYRLRDRVKIPAGIQWITGNWAYFSMANPVRFENGESLFYFEKSDHDVVLMEKMLSPFAYLANREAGHTNGGYFIDNVMDNSTTLLLRDMFINYPYYRGSGNGKVYVENVNIGGSNVNGGTGNPTGNGDVHNLQRPGFDVNGQTFFAKHVDSEFFRPNFKFTNANAKIQGFKVGEKHGTHFEVVSSDVEILGGVVNTVRGAGTSELPETIQILKITDSKVSFVGHERGVSAGKTHRSIVWENQRGTIRTLKDWAVPDRTGTIGKFFTLYSTAIDPSNSVPTNLPPPPAEDTTEIAVMDTEVPMVIDGNLTEESWDAKYSITKTVVDFSDNQATFSVTWDENSLYVAVEVKDENLHSEGTSAEYLDDGIEIYIDGDASGGNTYDGSDDFQFFMPYNSTTVAAGPNSISNVTGIQYITKQTDSGYNFEASIPWSTLGVTKVFDGVVVGFDIAINDDDDGGDTREGQMVWAGTADNWRDPSAWGRITLISNTITSIEEEIGDTIDTLLYPNPTSGLVKISHKSPVDIIVFDNSGKQVLSLKKVTQFDMSSFPPGIYQVHIQGKVLEVKKLSKR